MAEEDEPTILSDLSEAQSDDEDDDAELEPSVKNTFSTSENTRVTHTSTIASNPSEAETNPSLVSFDFDDDDDVKPFCDGWCCGGGSTYYRRSAPRRSKDLHDRSLDRGRSFVSGTRQSPFSSRLYKRRRRGADRHRSANYLERVKMKATEKQRTKERQEADAREQARQEDEIARVNRASKREKSSPRNLQPSRESRSPPNNVRRTVKKKPMKKRPSNKGKKIKKINKA